MTCVHMCALAMFALSTHGLNRRIGRRARCVLDLLRPPHRALPRIFSINRPARRYTPLAQPVALRVSMNARISVCARCYPSNGAHPAAIATSTSVCMPYDTGLCDHCARICSPLQGTLADNKRDCRPQRDSSRPGGGHPIDCYPRDQLDEGCVASLALCGL